MAIDASVPVGARAGSVLRHSAWDAVLVGLSIVHGAALLFVPSVPVVAIGLWWNANTIAHTFIHTPFFRARELNLAFSVYLSAVLGIPQTLWRDRHLQHHSGRPHRLTASPLLLLETGVVVSLWLAMALAAPRFFFNVYVPGYALGLGLCFLQGYFEHARGTTSHYGRLYNVCFFNDGYHVEHHRRPGEHWTRLPGHAVAGAQHSAWPPVLRWLDVFSLESLERIVLRSRVLQRLVLAAHERALANAHPGSPPDRAGDDRWRRTLSAHGAHPPAPAPGRGTDDRRRPAGAHRHRAHVPRRRRSIPPRALRSALA